MADSAVARSVKVGRSKNPNVISAFAEEHVEQLTGLSKRQLGYWDRTGFFSPSLESTARTAFGRIYTFHDVVNLRVLGILRNDYKVPLQHLRQVAAQLGALGDDLWSRQVLAVLNRRVHIVDPRTGRARDALSGQEVLIPIETVANDVAAKAARLRVRSAAQHGAVEQHRHVAHNAWVVAGTRIPTSAIRRFRDAGYGIADILREYPSLTRRDVEAALKHEKRLARSA